MILELSGLFLLGLIAGVINTLAGGGSNLTIPALMLLGMPPEIANATNRVGVLLQSITGTVAFQHRGLLPLHDFCAMLLPMGSGALLGGLSASLAPPFLLKFLLLGAMVLVAGLTLLRPEVMVPPPGTEPKRIAEVPTSRLLLFLCGFYGGFVQAGVGFPLLAVFAGSLRYDLVKSNALKALAALFFTSVALVIFILNDQVRWLPGLALGCGSILGALAGVRLAITAEPRTLKWFLFVMTLAASAAALLHP